MRAVTWLGMALAAALLLAALHFARRGEEGEPRAGAAATAPRPSEAPEVAPPAPRPAAATPPATEAAPVDRTPPESGPDAEPTRPVIRAFLQSAFEAHLPRHKLSSDDYDALTDAVVRIREARAELAALPVTAENAERLRALREALVEALSDFEYVADVSPAEFSRIAQPGIGISLEDSAEPAEPETLDAFLSRE